MEFGKAGQGNMQRRRILDLSEIRPLGAKGESRAIEMLQ